MLYTRNLLRKWVIRRSNTVSSMLGMMYAVKARKILKRNQILSSIFLSDIILGSVIGDMLRQCYEKANISTMQ